MLVASHLPDLLHIQPAGHITAVTARLRNNQRHAKKQPSLSLSVGGVRLNGSQNQNIHHLLPFCIGPHHSESLVWEATSH